MISYRLLFFGVVIKNALKHGLEHNLSDGLLEIKLSIENKFLSIFVEDNGVGRKQSAMLSPTSTGIGLKVFKEFFDISNKFNTQKAGFVIKDIENANGEALGTRVDVFIPIDYKYYNM